MDYSLRALVGKPAVLASAIEEHLPFTRASGADPSHTQIVPLGLGLSLIPLSNTLLQELQGGEEAATSVPGFLMLSSSLMRWVMRASESGAIAYVEAEFYDVVRSQSASVWDRGQIALGPLHEKDAISRALAHLGVSAVDPFAAVGLGRFKSTEEWLSLSR